MYYYVITAIYSWPKHKINTLISVIYKTKSSKFQISILRQYKNIARQIREVMERLQERKYELEVMFSNLNNHPDEPMIQASETVWHTGWPTSISGAQIANVFSQTSLPQSTCSYITGFKQNSLQNTTEACLHCS